MSWIYERNILPKFNSRYENEWREMFEERLHILLNLHILYHKGAYMKFGLNLKGIKIYW